MRNHYLAVFSAATILATASMPAYAVKMVSGGVGESAQEMIERLEDRYNLKVIFTGERGMYLSDVVVTLKDKDGTKIAAGTTTGPIMLAQLAPGSYTLHAMKDGIEKTRKVRLNDDLRTYHVTFPIKDEPVAEPMVMTPLIVQKTNPDTTVGTRVEEIESE